MKFSSVKCLKTNKEFQLKVVLVYWLLGKGNVKMFVKLPDGACVEHVIVNVSYVPEVSKNLISISKSTKNGLQVVFEVGGSIVRFIKQGKLVISSVLINDLYRLNFQLPSNIVESNVTEGSRLMNWHERLGHPNFKALRTMHKISAVNDLKINNIGRIHLKSGGPSMPMSPIILG